MVNSLVVIETVMCGINEKVIQKFIIRVQAVIISQYTFKPPL